MRRIGGGVRNIFGDGEFVLVTGAAEVFVAGGRLSDRSYGLRVKPAMEGAPALAGQRCEFPVPGCLRRGYDRTGRQDGREDDGALGDSESRYLAFGGFLVLSADVGKELRFFFLLLLFLRCSVLELSGLTALG